MAKKLCTPCCAQPDRRETKDDSRNKSGKIRILRWLAFHTSMIAALKIAALQHRAKLYDSLRYLCQYVFALCA